MAAVTPPKPGRRVNVDVVTASFQLAVKVGRGASVDLNVRAPGLILLDGFGHGFSFMKRQALTLSGEPQQASGAFV